MENFLLEGDEALKAGFMNGLIAFFKEIEELEYSELPNYTRLKNHLKQCENILDMAEVAAQNDTLNQSIIN